jgi:hypothetical protein
MTTKTLEEVLRDLAKRGELSHISLAQSQSSKMWRASFAMCSRFGVSYAEDEQPDRALLLALTTANLKKPRVTVDLKPDEFTRTIEADRATDECLAGIQAHVPDQSVEDLM